MPYSTSVPMTLRIATVSTSGSQVLPCGDPLDHAALGISLDEGPDVDDALALLPGDLGPVVGVGRVGQILVLAELLLDRREEVLGAHTTRTAADLSLDGVLLRPAHDVLDHRPGGEVLEEEDLTVAIGVGDLEEAILVRLGVHRVDGDADHLLDQRLRVAADFPELGLVQGDGVVQVDAEDLAGGRRVRPVDLDLHVQAPGSEDRRVDQVLPVRGADDDDVLERLDAIELGQELGDDGRLHVGADPRAPGPEQGIHLVEEDDHGNALVGLLLGPLEDQPDLTLGLADPLVQELRAFDVEEVATDIGAAGALGDGARQAVGDRLGDEGLAASRRPVQEDTLGRHQAVVVEQFLVDEWQLDGIADRLDLVRQTTDLLVGDVGHLLEDEFLDLGAGELLEHQARPGVDADEVARPEVLVLHRVGELHDLFFVGVGDHHHPAVLQLLADAHHLAGPLEATDVDHVVALVEEHFLADRELLDLDRRLGRHAQLAVAGHHVEGAVLVDLEDGAEVVRRCGQLLDLGPQHAELLTGFLENRGQLVVLGSEAVDRAVRLRELSFEPGHISVLGLPETTAKLRHLFFESRNRATQFHRFAWLARSAYGPISNPVASAQYTERFYLSQDLFIRPSLGRPVPVPGHCHYYAFPGYLLVKPPHLQERSHDEGLDRSGPLHRRRPVRRDRP